MRTRSLLFIISIFCWVNGVSQTDSATMDAIVITATRDSLPVSLANVAVTVMRTTDIMKVSARSVPEMLQEQPGVFMQKTTHAGGSPFIRGLTGNQVLEMIDGIRLNNATFRYGPNQYLSTIDPFTVQRAEVLRNAYSTLYGSDAMGGIVNIITADPQYAQNGKRVYGGLSLKGMTGNMERTASGKLAYSNKHLAWENIGTFSAFGDAVAADGVVQTPTSYSQHAFHSKMKTRVSENHELTFAYQYLQQDDVDLFDQVTQRGFLFHKINEQQRQLGYLRSRINLGNKMIRAITTTLSGQYSRELRSSQRNNSPLINSGLDKVMTYGMQIDLPMEFGKAWKGRSGVDLYHDKVRSSASDSNTVTGSVVNKRGLYADGSTMTSFSVFHQQYFDLNNWQFAGGIRLNAYHTKIDDPSFGTLRFDPLALAGNLSATYRFNPNWRLTGSLNSAYRAPNINDLSSFGKFDFGVEVPSPDLRPERSLNKELMLHVNYHRTSFAFAAFHNKLTDLIDRVKTTYEEDTLYQGDRVYQKENIGDAYIYGFETYFSVNINKKLQFNGNLTYTYGQNSTANQPLRRIPPLFVRLELQYHWNRFFGVLNWVGAGEQDRLAPGDLSDHRINPRGTPGFGVLAMRAGWSGGILSLEAGLENILDQAYRYHGSGIDGYGRHLWLRTSLRF